MGCCLAVMFSNQSHIAKGCRVGGRAGTGEKATLMLLMILTHITFVLLILDSRYMSLQPGQELGLQK